jgi:hypothetical protein
MFTHRQQKRMKAVIKQISDAGGFIPCSCGDPSCFVRATRKDKAMKIITGQTKTLKLNQQMIDFVLSRVQLC